MLAYLQLSPLPAEMLMQNAAFPVATGGLPLVLLDRPIEFCALAIDTPPSNSAKAVIVVSVFIPASLFGCRAFGTLP